MRKIRNSVRLGGIFGGVLLLGLTGCSSGDGPSLGNVSGTVKLNGKPLAGALVEFQPSPGSPSQAITDHNGGYRLRYTRDKAGAMLGAHTVRISTWRRSENEQGQDVIIPEQVPARYNQQSELTAKVESGRNTIDFDLQGDGSLAGLNGPPRTAY